MLSTNKEQSNDGVHFVSGCLSVVPVMLKWPNFPALQILSPWSLYFCIVVYDSIMFSRHPSFMYTWHAIVTLNKTLCMHEQSINHISQSKGRPRLISVTPLNGTTRVMCNRDTVHSTNRWYIMLWWHSWSASNINNVDTNIVSKTQPTLPSVNRFSITHGEGRI